MILFGISPIYVSASSQKMAASRDTFVLSGSPNSNYGGFMLLFAGDLFDPSGFGLSGNPGDSLAYLYFDLSSLSYDFDRVLLYVPGAIGPYDGVSLDAYVTTTQWGEYDLTWNNRPSLGSLVGRAMLYYFPDYELPEYDLITHISGNDDISVCLTAPMAIDTIFYTSSREYGNIQSENLPYIEIRTSTQIPGYLISGIMATIGISVAIYILYLKNQMKKK